MKIKWLGHACFLVTSQSGLRILTDPYHEGDGLAYGPIKETADIVLVSHDHFDHNNINAVRGSPLVVREPGKREARGINLEGFAAWHDASGGRKRGPVVIFVFAVDGLRLCHLGDLGHDLDLTQAGKLGKVDILFAPVGGVYTIDSMGVDRLCRLIKPGFVIPMHYKTPKVTMPVATADYFLKGKTLAACQGVSEIEVTRENLPAALQVVLLQPAN
jgi:L-ascorbate metabolism protein UlaG (beta-lactamase superfamily)